MPSKHRVATLSTVLAVAVLAAACTGSDDEPTSTVLLQESVAPQVAVATRVVVAPQDTAVPQVAAAPEVAEPSQVDDQGSFLRVIAALDEERGYCLDIPGHMSGVRLASPLQAHTCKHGIWNQDGRFDVAALANGTIRMPFYELCLQAEDAVAGATLILEECTEAELQTWTVRDSGEIALEAFPLMCITIGEGPGRDAGGPQYLMRGAGLDICAQEASGRQQWTTVIPQ